MRADPSRPAARAIPRTKPKERARAFGALRQQHGFSDYALHEAVKGLNCTWIVDHVDAVLAQTLATRAYRALNRVCLGQARRCAFAAGAGGSEASRTNATTPGCASSSNRRRRAILGICSGRATDCLRSSTGKIR